MKQMASCNYYRESSIPDRSVPMRVLKSSESAGHFFNPCSESLGEGLEGKSEAEKSNYLRKRKRSRAHTHGAESDERQPAKMKKFSLSQYSTLAAFRPQSPTSVNSFAPTSHSFEHFQPLLPFTIPVLRFERVGLLEWEIKESRIFDIPNFLLSLRFSEDVHLFLLNEERLKSALQTRKMTIDHTNTHPHSLSPGVPFLEDELTRLSAVVAYWSRDDLQQLQHYLKGCEDAFVKQQKEFLITQYHHESITVPSRHGLADNHPSSGPPASPGLLQSWQLRDQTNPSLKQLYTNSQTTPIPEKAQSPHNATAVTMGYIGYEVEMYVTLVVRKNPDLDLDCDLSCKVFRNQLVSVCEDILQQREVAWKSPALLDGLMEMDSEELWSRESYFDPITFGEILFHFFPHLLFAVKKYLDVVPCRAATTIRPSCHFSAHDVLVKYASVSTVGLSPRKTLEQFRIGAASTFSLSPPRDFAVPQMRSLSDYQTIGSFCTPANYVMARMSSEAVVHDFVLELLM